MKKKQFFSQLIIVILLLLTTTNQRISSSPDNFSEPKDKPIPTQTERELNELQEVFEKYDTWITNEIAESNTVGAAIAITYKDQIAYLKCFGTRKLGSDEPVDEHTIFRLASVSKPVTAVLSAILAEEQILNFDEKVTEILPDLKFSNSRFAHNLCIRNLLSHTTGLVPHAYDDLVENHVPYSMILNRLKNTGMTAEPGKVYGYQNVMFSLIDTILSVKTSKNYSQLIHEKLFEPLKMADASTDFQSFFNNPNKAYPHRGGNGIYRSIPLNDRYYSTAPAAGVNASIYDMSQFLIALLNDYNPLISNEMLETIFEPQVISRLSSGYFKYWDNVKTKHYALGWRMVDYKNRQIAYHGGYVNGYKAEIALSRHDNIGIVYLSNSPNTVASQSVPNFFNTYFEFKDNRPEIVLSSELKKDEEPAYGI